MKYRGALVIFRAIYKFVTPRDWTAARILFVSVTLMRIQITGWACKSHWLNHGTSGPFSSTLCPGVTVGTDLRITEEAHVY